MGGIKIEAGHVFASQREACEAIGIEYKNSTNSRRACEKEFDRRWKWHKEGRKIIVDEVYPEIKEKIENRGKSQGSRNNYKGIYAEFIDALLLQYLQKEEDKLKDTCEIHTTNNKIAEATGIVNYNYRTAYNEREKFYNTVKKDFNIKTNTYCMKDVFYWTKSKIREIVKSSLDRLQKAELLEYELCYFLYMQYKERIPLEDEMKAIITAEEETMKEMGIEHKKKIDNSYELSKEFNKKVLGKVQKDFDYIESIFKGYTISLWEDIALKTDSEIKESMIKLNNLVISSLKEKPEKTQKKTKKDEGIGKWFGARNPFWKPWVFDRMSKKYIEHCYSFIDILCNLNAINIVEKIKNCKSNKISSKITQQQKDEYKDKILDELLDKIDLEDIELPY
ncbi:hypothetical protein OSC52_12060 [Clostridium pasteurianum]|uniref:hypothetical protein n=1 Tax=Clostridium pasteurianum TaxID=1501 RepID=UPI002260879E|nr:hypothetical protein [Clostridium pasteurianum]UZW12590.1 hypothetical protein OSC52_12060 [Clostridium pasteurianum]